MTVTVASTTASESYYANPPDLAVDGNPATHWITNAGALPQWWSALLSAATPVTEYAITSDDAARAINSWLFQGTNDSLTDVPAGSITTASTQYDSGTYAATSATDDNWSSRWASATPAPQWLCVQLPAAVVYTEYCLGGYVTEMSGQPEDWTFEGSNDGSTWTTLDTQSGVTTWWANTFNTYSCANSTAYLYYRINVSVNGDGSYVRLARFRLGPPTNWVTLDTQSGVTWSVPETKTFSFANTTAYDNYRVYITANNGDSYTQIAEILMTDVPAAGPYSSAVLADSPLAYWRLGEGAAVDSGSNGVAWGYQGGVVSGKMALLSDGGTSVSGSGSQGIASLGSVPSALTGTAVTMEMWVKIPAGDVTGAFFKFGSTADGWGLGVGNGTWSTAGKNLILLVEQKSWHDTGIALSTGTHLITCTRYSTNQFRLVVDGSSDDFYVETPYEATVGICVGSDNNTAHFLSSDVDVDNFTMFASDTASRATEHYNGGAGDNTAVAADSPVVWLKLDETVSETVFEDASGNSRPLTVVGSPTFGIAAAESGIDGTAITLASGNYGEIADPSSWLGGLTEFSLETWFKITSLPSGDGASILSMDNLSASPGSSQRKFNLYMGSSGAIAFMAFTSAVGYPYALAMGPYNDGTWHHIVATCDSTTLTIYIDGVSVATQAVGGTLSGGSAVQLRLGACISDINPAYLFAGSLDEAAVYPVALTADRVLAHYNAGEGVSTDFTGSCALSGEGSLSVMGSLGSDLGSIQIGAAPVVAVPALSENDLGSVQIAALANVMVALSENDLGVIGMGSAVAVEAVLTATGVPVDLGAIAIGAMAGIGTLLQLGPDLGAVGIVVGPLTTTVLAAPGTLANPYHAAATDSRAVDFASALYVPSDPTALSGPVDAPSVWYEFTELEAANWLGTTSGFAHGATIEFFIGPDGATATDLTFIATDGAFPLDLGAVTVDVATSVVTAFTAGSVDLGAVTMDAAPGLELASFGIGAGVDLGPVTADSMATLVVALGAGVGLDLGGVTLDETVELAEVLS